MNQGNTDNNATKTEAKDFFQFSGDFFVITLTTIAFYFGDLGLKRKKKVENEKKNCKSCTWGVSVSQSSSKV